MPWIVFQSTLSDGDLGLCCQNQPIYYNFRPLIDMTSVIYCVFQRTEVAFHNISLYYLWIVCPYIWPNSNVFVSFQVCSPVAEQTTFSNPGNNLHGGSEESISKHTQEQHNEASRVLYSFCEHACCRWMTKLTGRGDSRAEILRIIRSESCFSQEKCEKGEKNTIQCPTYRWQGVILFYF